MATLTKLLGDFNADRLSDSFDAAYIRSLLTDHSLKLVDHGFTHISGSSLTWLDLCMVDNSDVIVSWNKSEAPFAAGHFLISVK